MRAPDWHLVRPADAEEHAVARLRQAEAGRDLQRRSIRHAPAEHRRDEMPGVADRRRLGAAESAVRLDADGEILAAEAARRAARQSAERARNAEAVAELEPLILRQILFEDEVLGDVPSSGGAGQNQLALELVRACVSELGNRLERERSASDDF